MLGLTRPDIVESIHRDYLDAGAWILSTNTFNGSPVSQAEYGLEHLVYDMNRAAAENARRALDGAEDRFVVGSLGPTNRTLSISPKVEDPAFRTITFDELTEAYAEQIRGLVDGGVDVLQIETIFDTLNAKAAIAAAQDVAPDLPLWLSFTAVDQSGRNLSGQTAEAFWLSIEHAEPMIVGVNCSLGAAQMRPVPRGALTHRAHLHGLLPQRRAAQRDGTARRGPGDHERLPRRVRASRASPTSSEAAAGRRPEHIRQIAEAVRDLPPRRSPTPTRRSPRSAASSRSSSAPTPGS